MARCFCNNSNNVLSANDNNIVNDCGCNNTSAAVADMANTVPSRCNPTKSLQDKLCDFLGHNCVCTFSTCCDGELEEKRGLLTEVGCNYIVLRSLCNGNCTICSTDNLQTVSVSPVTNFMC